MAGLFLIMQLVPYGHQHVNPPVQSEPAWNTVQTRTLFFQACGDCHSNQTIWPWYSHLAPVSWLVQRDVNHGREEFNVSEWGRPENEGGEAAETVHKGTMPPDLYLITHRGARLTPSELQALTVGLRATFGVAESSETHETGLDDAD
jgi:mono/diheme cytochrome c family protein